MVARELRSSTRLSGAGAADAPRRERVASAEPSPAQRAAAAAERRQRAAERAREVEDSPHVLREKCRRLARALRNAKHLVVYTGAGISTAADIPDYRGPRGVWTRLRRGEGAPRVDAAAAEPTFTHMALAALYARGTLKFLVSQNCDGLHVRAGTPRRALAELHGDMFAERCAACRRVYLRAFDTTERTARHRHGTRRLCHACGAELTDTIVHFGERGRAAWPLNWAGALRHAARADVVLCLGSSLKVLRRYPRLWRMCSPPHARPALYIVNLQWTPKDAVAALKINARCDDVMRAVARRLRLRVPRYRRARDPLLAHAEPLAPPEAHTTRRAPLRPASPLARLSEPDEPASPSASDSDEELPLRRLADRLRAAAPPPAALRAFRVAMQGCEPTILLRAQHAPPPPPPRAAAASKLRRLLERAPSCDLRPTIERDAEPKLERDAEQKLYWRTEPKLEREPELKVEQEPEVKVERESEVKVERQVEVKPELGSEELAAAIIARAVLLCRGSLYPGLHTIVGVEGARAECAWCWRVRAAPRCLWYGPARLTPPHARAWRRRRLCACCAPDAPAPPAAPPAPPAPDTAGWYGKGYRKGRRRRR